MLKKEKWQPKKWRPEYDRIVAYSVMGKANTWIAQTLGFTPEHVSSILNTPHGLDLAAKLQEKLAANIESTVPDELAQIGKQAIKRLKSLMDNDEIFEKSPFAVVDRGMDVLKGLRHLVPGGNGAAIQAGGNITQIGQVVLSPQQHTDILDGLRQVKEIKNAAAIDKAS